MTTMQSWSPLVARRNNGVYFLDQWSYKTVAAAVINGDSYPRLACQGDYRLGKL